MLIRFSVQNYRSIGEEPVVLNMVSSTKIREHASHVVNFDTVKVLRDAVIYGANAAGKSNLIRALEYVVNSVRDGMLIRNSGSLYCKSIEDGAQKKTEFSIQYEIDNRFFAYGFSCSLMKERIEEEWLYEFKSGKEIPLFERVQSEVKSAFLDGLSEESRKRVEVYTDDFERDSEENPNKLFLSALNQGRRFDAESGMDFLAKSYEWLTNNVILVQPERRLNTSLYYYFKNLNQASDLIATFDTGISFLEKQKSSIEDLKGYLSHPEMSLLRAILEAQPNEYAMTVRGDGVLAGIEKKRSEDPEVTILKIKHEGSSFDFDFGDESAGTKRLFDMLDMLLTEKTDVVFVLDELSKGFHPLLTKHFVDLFNEIHANDKCQLVFTTHENDVMSFDHFRRDEIWFVERGNNGISTLYPLDDFVSDGLVRSDTRVGKNYMEGRYGGIPVLSLQESIDALGE